MIFMFPRTTTKDAELVMRLMLLLGGSFLLYGSFKHYLLHRAPSKSGRWTLPLFYMVSCLREVPHHIVAIIQQCINKQLRGNYYTNKTVHSFWLLTPCPLLFYLKQILVKIKKAKENICCVFVTLKFLYNTAVSGAWSTTTCNIVLAVHMANSFM